MTQTEENKAWRQKQILEPCDHESRNAGSLWKLKEAKTDIPPPPEPLEGV